MPNDRDGTKHLKMCVYEINVKPSVLMFPRYFSVKALGSTGRIHRDGR